MALKSTDGLTAMPLSEALAECALGCGFFVFGQARSDRPGFSTIKGQWDQ